MLMPLEAEGGTGFRIQDSGFGIQEVKDQVPGVRG
jgi:hypothetical protein